MKTSVTEFLLTKPRKGQHADHCQPHSLPLPPRTDDLDFYPGKQRRHSP